MIVENQFSRIKGVVDIMGSTSIISFIKVVHNSFSIMVVEEEARGCISILAEFIYLLVLDLS